MLLSGDEETALFPTQIKLQSIKNRLEFTFHSSKRNEITNMKNERTRKSVYESEKIRRKKPQTFTSRLFTKRRLYNSLTIRSKFG
jgi:hypothetical protein